jgi:RNase P/RNase MRP subunit p30
MRERVDILTSPNRDTSSYSSSIHLPMRAGAMRERVDILTAPNRETSSSIHLPMRAGAMRERVDILTAPNRDTSSSNQGTVAARPTAKDEIAIVQRFFKGILCHDLEKFLTCKTGEKYPNSVFCWQVKRIRYILL